MVINIDGDDANAITIDGDEVTEVTIDGDVAWTGLTVIDDFNSGFDAAWTGDRGDFSTTTTAWEGSHSLTPSTALTRIDLTKSTGELFGHGERLKFYTRAEAIGGTTSPAMQLYWSYISGSDWWRTELRYGSGQLNMTRRISGTASERASQSVSVSATTWYEVTITRDDGTLGGSNNDLTVELRNASTGTLLATLTTNDSTHSGVNDIRLELWGIGDGYILTDYMHKTS